MSETGILGETGVSYFVFDEYTVVRVSPLLYSVDLKLLNLRCVYYRDFILLACY